MENQTPPTNGEQKSVAAQVKRLLRVAGGINHMIYYAEAEGRPPMYLGSVTFDLNNIEQLPVMLTDLLQWAQQQKAGVAIAGADLLSKLPKRR